VDKGVMKKKTRRKNTASQQQEKTIFPRNALSPIRQKNMVNKEVKKKGGGEGR